MPSSVTIEGIEFTRFVQSSFRLKGSGLVIYIDPHKLTASEVGNEQADLILITHPHFDHLDPQAVDACRKASTVIVANAPCAQEIKDRPNVVSVKEGDVTTQKGLSIRAVAGYNDFHDRTEGFNVGLVFGLDGKQIYHAGDTGKVPEMGEIGSLDVALVPIGGTYTMDETEAAEAVTKLLKPSHVVPMHYGYATGGDPSKFQELVANAAQVHIIEPVLDIKAS